MKADNFVSGIPTKPKEDPSATVEENRKQELEEKRKAGLAKTPESQTSEDSISAAESPKKKKAVQYREARKASAFFDIFLKGRTTSEPIQIADDVSVVFRTLMPADWTWIHERANEYDSADAKLLAEQILKLAKAIVILGNGPLELDGDELEILKQKLGRQNVSKVDQAADILSTQMSQEALDYLEEHYTRFHREIHGVPVSELKKKFLGTPV